MCYIFFSERKSFNILYEEYKSPKKLEHPRCSKIVNNPHIVLYAPIVR